MQTEASIIFLAYNQEGERDSISVEDIKRIGKHCDVDNVVV